MKKFFCVFAVLVFVLAANSTVAAEQRSTGRFGGVVFSVFKEWTVGLRQTLQDVSRRLRGARDEAARPEPSLVFTAAFDDVWNVGSDKTVSWSYSFAREATTRISLVDHGGEVSLVTLLPARTGIPSASDDYAFHVDYEPGVYRVRVCNGSACATSTPFAVRYAALSESGSHVRGVLDAPVTLTAWIDYTSAPVVEFWPAVDRAFAAFAGRVNIVVKPFPSVSPIRVASQAAEAVECAGRQGEQYFWSLHDWLLVRRDVPWTFDELSLFVGAFSQSGFDRVAFDACVDGREAEAVIAAYVREGNRKMVVGTPTFVVSDARSGVRRTVAGLVSYEALVAEIRAVAPDIVPSAPTLP